MALIVRAARADDLPAMLALYRQLNPNDPPAGADAAAAAWGALIGNPGTTVFVADVDNIPVSSCTLVIIPNITRGARSYALIENVVTDAAHRRKGLARSLLAAALDAAWGAGCYKVMLATGRTDAETLRFYEQSGFSRGGKTHFEARRV
jgi:GNAT superfamily N-acetyltransferase